MKRVEVSRYITLFEWIILPILSLIALALTLTSSCSEPDRSSLNEDCNDLCLALEYCSKEEYSGDEDMRNRFYDEENGFGSVGECSEDCKKKADGRERECMIDCLEHVRRQEPDDDVADDDVTDDDVDGDDDATDDDTSWDDFYYDDDIEDEFNFSAETCGEFLNCIKDCLGL